MFKLHQASGASDEVLLSITGDDVEAAAARVQGDAQSVIQAPAEEAVLASEIDLVGALLADNAAYDLVVDVLRAADFASPACAAVFEAVADVVEGRNKAFQVADPVSIASLPAVAKLAALKELREWAAAAPTSKQALLTRASIVKNAAGERSLGRAVQKMQSIVSEDRSLESKSDDILGLLAGATEIRSLPLMSLGDAAVQALSSIADRAQSGVASIGIPYGFRDLDALTGGMQGGQLIVLAARPGIGKTAAALSMALNATAAGVHVLMASMEMKARELSKRCISIVSDVDSHAIRLGALNEEQWEHIVTGAEQLTQLAFDIVDLPSVDVPGLSGLARRRHREGKLGLIVVDYLQIMKTSGTKGMNREQQIGEISRGLKELAMALDVPVIVLSQLNRSVETRIDKRPQLSDLRESGAIEQDADVVIFIHRDDAGAKNVVDVSPSEFIVAKQRDGALGDASVCFKRRTTAFSDYASPTSAHLLAA